MTPEEINKKIEAGEVQFLEDNREPLNTEQKIDENDDLFFKLRRIKPILSSAPQGRAVSFIDQIAFYDDAGTKKMAINIGGSWYSVSLTLIT